MSMGVRINGKDAPSKAAVRRALADDPASVYFYGTSLFGDGFSPENDGFGISGNIRRADWDGPGFAAWRIAFADRIARGVVTFVGPNPYTSRRFYGQLTWTRDGRIGVK